VVISGGIAAVLGLISYLTLKFRSRSVRLFVAAVFFFVAFALTIIAGNKIGSKEYIYLPVGFSYFVALGLILTPRVDRLVKHAAILGALMLMCLSVGSDTGMKVSSYGLIWAFPLVLAAGAYVLEIGFASKRRTVSVGHSTAILFFFALYAGYAVVNLSVDVYRDSGSRLSMTKTVDQPLLRFVPTTVDRARVVTELFQALDAYVKPDDYLLTFESIGMVHFAARTRPYAGNPWPILYLPSEFKRYLARDEANLGLPAAIVTARKQTRSSSWPASGSVSNNAVAVADRRILEEFISRNGYSIAWQNDMFNIYARGVRQ
jgi:hypothetical protein